MLEDSTSLVRKTLRSTYVTSVISIALVLFILGILGVLLLQANHAGNYLKENFQITIILKPEAQQTEVNDLVQLVQRNMVVKSATYISKDEAAQKLKGDLGEDFVSFLGYNPLNPSIDVRFKADYVDDKNIDLFKQYLANKPVIQEFYYQKSLVNNINQNLKTISAVVLGFASILIVVAIIIINNTIRISLYAKRMLIKSMQLVGATKSFIRKPFLIRAIMNGFFAAVLAGLLVVLLVFAIRKQYTEVLFAEDNMIWLQLFAGLIGISVLISVLSTFFAVNKWLSKSASELY